VKTRLALTYVALFVLMGLHLPFWPVWLADRGMDADRIGILLGVTMWARLVAPWVGARADRGDGGATIVRALAVGLLVVLVAFSWADGFVGLFLLSAALGLAFAPIIPLVDGIALTAASAGRLDYGRVRLWGSAAFIVAAVGGGIALEGRDPSLVLRALQGAALALALAAMSLRAPARVETHAVTVSIAQVVRRPGMGTFLLAVAFLQASHAVLYGFGTEHWLAIGIEASTIGWLWATGVVAEVILFAFGERVVARIGPAGLLMIAGVGGVLRWSALAEIESVGVLFVVQVLHAASFAAMHLGAMSWIRHELGPREIHRATALYVAIAGGLALGIGMPLAGVLFDRLRGSAYHAMSMAAALGLAFAWSLSRSTRARRSAAPSAV